MTIEKMIGDYRFLSNFWPAKVMLDGVEYRTTDHGTRVSGGQDDQDR